MTDPGGGGATKSQASGSSFYAAMRLMPPPERSAMFAIYDFCRKVDDIADDPGPSREERRAQLDAWRADLDRVYAGQGPERISDLVEPIRRFGLAKADFLAVIDGMQMDVDDTLVAPSFDVLDLYCDRVASAVGRLSVRIFAMAPAEGLTLAHHLGRALQFTNILRDLDEDAAIGRLYLPAQALEAGLINAGAPTAVLDDPGLDQACRWLAAKAHKHYLAADRVLASPTAGGRRRAPRLMSAVYRRILARMEAEGWSPPRRRVSLGKTQLAWILLTRGLAP